jgi:large subunit ribosomal protein L31
MKTDIHPKYTVQNFTCSCGNVIELPSTTKGQGIEICSECHPYYTGKQKTIDSGGRIQKFTSKYTTVVGAARKTRKEIPVKEAIAAPATKDGAKEKVSKVKVKTSTPSKVAANAAPAEAKATEAPAAEAPAAEASAAEAAE